MKRWTQLTLSSLVVFSSSLCAMPAVPAAKKNGDQATIIKPLSFTAPSIVKALVKERSEGALVEAKGSFKVVDLATGEVLSSGFNGRRFYLHPLKDGLKWGEAFAGIYQIEIIPATASSKLLVDGIEYDGSVAVYQVDQRVHLVNHVSMEDYLKAMLATQFGAQKYESSVFDAIAICARTQLVHTVNKFRQRYWHVEAKQSGYLGCSEVTKYPHIARAVEGTHGKIMLHQYRPFPAMWTEHSAGMTARYENVYRKNEVAPEGVELQLAKQNRDKVKWSFEIAKEDLAALLKLDNIANVELYIDPPSNKVYALRFKKGDDHEVITFTDFQKLVGEARIPSNDFGCKITEDALVFEGYGKGLGVGMCLFTANEFAKKGEKAEKILSAFFPSAQSANLDETPQSNILVKR